MAQPFNSSDRKAIRAAEKASALRAIQDAEAITAIMSSIPGRAWMWRKLGEARVFHNDFTGDALREAFNSGERNFGMRLLDDVMKHCPDTYLQMIKEANNDRHDSNNGSPLAERHGSPQPDGGDSGPYGGSAEGSEPDYDPYQDGDPGTDEDIRFNKAAREDHLRA